MLVLAWFVAAAALGVALGSVAWAQRASNSAPFRAHLAERDRQLDETQRDLDRARERIEELAAQVLDREGVVAQLTGQVARAEERAERIKREALRALDERDGASTIDLREERVDER